MAIDLDAAIYAFDSKTMGLCFLGLFLVTFSRAQGGYQTAHPVGPALLQPHLHSYQRWQDPGGQHLGLGLLLVRGRVLLGAKDPCTHWRMSGSISLGRLPIRIQ
jgi:hypothetical protein